MHINAKAVIDAPCGFPVEKKRGETGIGYPDIVCSFSCENCGWNPKEIKRRWKTGTWGPAVTRFNCEKEEVVLLPPEVKRLYFKGVENGSEIPAITR